VELTALVAVEQVAVALVAVEPAAEATAKVVTALVMAAVVAPEARATEALEAVAGDMVAVVMVAEARGEAAVEAAAKVGVAPVAVAWAAVDSAVVAREELEAVTEAQMAATRSMRSTPAVLRCGLCPWWCVSSTRPPEATMQVESMGEGSRRSSLHRGTSGTPRLASRPTPCIQHAWG